MKSIFLKIGRDKSIRNRHPWVFSGAIATMPQFEDGDFLTVYNADKQCLGTGYFNKKSSIIGRMVSFNSDSSPLDALRAHLVHALKLRTLCFNRDETNALRLINGESDLLPGLIVDQYNDILVIQISTLGMEKLRGWLVDTLVELLHPQGIYEQSQLPTRKEEGLLPVQGLLYGTVPEEIEIRENGLKMIVPLIEGQKTGLFLDHREMRKWMGGLSSGKKVLNCFSYTGAFSLYALAGGASKVDSVEISQRANVIAERNFLLNRFSPHQYQVHTADVFDFLRQNELDYQLMILDPPAFCKRRKDLVSACRGYKDINRIAMQKLPKDALLLTCSCSYHVSEELFQQVVFQAAVEAKRNVRIIGKHRIAADHPVSIFHPEGNYLKSLLLYIE